MCLFFFWFFSFRDIQKFLISSYKRDILIAPKQFYKTENMLYTYYGFY